ncbi:ASCH domain-containing protein [Capnocytophaga canimorsus]|uniref:ASCH domain-containing protein n=1 Tax=Capnocytophaga canimorsus TaxID=28188 RepID=UPI00385C7D78
MKVLLSIKPEFAKKIFDGTKKFEFRKTIFKNKNVKKVIVYASSPVQKVIGEFEIEKIISKEIDALWIETQDYSGISEEFFYEYFSKKEIGHAIKIKKAKKYSVPKNLREEYDIFPPQSFVYLPNPSQLEEIEVL